MKQSFGVLFLICLALLITFCDGSANVHVSESFIVDDAGRVRIYHGVNFVQKGFPWYPSELLDPANVATLSQAGVNFIRLGYLL
jgi:endoglycosylceramidase